MSDGLIILCPGQGAQHTGMGQAWAEASPEAAETFAQANEILGFDLQSVCFAGPDEKVNRTDMAQAGIYTTSVACYRALKARDLIGDATAVAGLSLGEYTALHLAGAFSFEDGLKLVWQRGTFMQEAAEANPSTMVALIGADEEAALALCDEARGDQVLSAANFNCPGQIVISGHHEACERATALAGEKSLRAVPLSVAGAFHSALMQDAADRMAKALAEANWNSPNLPVCSNVTGEYHSTDPSEIQARLVEQITHPVRWETNLRQVSADAEAQLVEMAPGKVLSGHMKKIERRRKVVNYATPPSE